MEKEESLLLLHKARIAEIFSWIFLGEFIDNLFMNILVGRITTLAFSGLISFAAFIVLRHRKEKLMEKAGVVDEETRLKKVRELSGK